MLVECEGDVVKIPKPEILKIFYGMWILLPYLYSVLGGLRFTLSLEHLRKRCQELQHAYHH